MPRVKVQSRRRPAESAAVPFKDVARVAYVLFQQRGGTHGHDFEDWLEAERLVRARRTVARTGKRTAAA